MPAISISAELNSQRLVIASLEQGKLITHHSLLQVKQQVNSLPA